MNREEKTYLNYLKHELDRRVEKNQNYSLRAFAKMLGVNIGTLSSILNGKRPLSLKMAKKMIEKLGWSAEKSRDFLLLVSEEQKKRNLKRVSPSLKDFHPQSLDVDVFKVIGDWYHPAILELVTTKGFRNDSRWVAKKLGISVLEAKTALERLIDLELIIEEKGKWRKSTLDLETSDKSLTTSALKRLQKQFLEKAIAALEEQSYERRYSRGMTMAIDENKIELAKDLINDFSVKLCHLLEEGDKEKKVYQLSINLFGLEKS